MNELSITEAKATAVAVMDAVVADLPHSQIISSEQPPTGTWQSCDVDRYAWANWTRLELQQKSVPELWLDSIEKAWAKKPGYTTSRRDTPQGMPRVIIDGPGGSLYLVNPEHDGIHFRIDAFSSCVMLPEGMTPGDDF